MNFQNFRTQLDELNQFFAYIEQRFTAEELSHLDRDILMGYVRDLYKSFFVAEKTPPVRPQLPLQELPKVDVVPEKVAETVIEKATQKIELEIEETPVVQTPIVETPIVETLAFVMPAIEEPAIEEEQIIEQAIIESPVVETVEVIDQINATEIVAEPQQTGMVILQPMQLVDTSLRRPEVILNTVSDDQMFERAEVHFNPEYDDLFYIKDSKELSQKLADSRIEDLNKAMGLNDKFLYINELFGGNAARFKLAIDYFNQEAKTLNDARTYIERDLIEQFKWNSPLKTSLSKDFIKLLRRRYQK
jgi:hypothetical protein